ncbi:MAG TPA: hypothetical protein VFJ97_02110 [Dermatophilaceae bacterium]|nr:hypothetical protein [Dermatophilaceae bacterium]
MSVVAVQPTGRRHTDVAHHHPGVVRSADGWAWVCPCGAAAARIPATPTTWRRALIGALRHSTELAA